MVAVELLEASEAEQRQAEVAAALARAGAKAGDRVALVTADGGLTADRLCFIGGALRTGVIPVVLHAALTERERKAQLADAQPSFVVDDEHLDELVSVGRRIKEAELAPWPLGRPMLYTSGTTGEPKGVWTGVLHEADARALAADEQEQWAFDPDDRHLACGNVHHSAPLRFSLGTLLAGGSVILPGKFDAAMQLDAIKRFEPTSSFMAPIHLQRLLDLAFDDPKLFRSFRLVAHAGAPISHALKRRALATFVDGTVWEFYGATEGQFTACSPDEWLARPGTVGRARPGRTMQADADGVLWCTPPRHGRFTYWNDPKKTADAWRGDSFSVFDLGHLDAEGYVFLDGRRDDLILTGGVNVYPAEVERVLLDLDGIDDAAVFPRDDESWGQRVCAVFVGRADTDAVAAQLKRTLASHKRPKELHVVDEIPRSSNGKVRRSLLAAELGLD